MHIILENEKSVHLSLLYMFWVLLGTI